MSRLICKCADLSGLQIYLLFFCKLKELIYTLIQVYFIARRHGHCRLLQIQAVARSYRLLQLTVAVLFAVLVVVCCYRLRSLSVQTEAVVIQAVAHSYSL